MKENQYKIAFVILHYNAIDDTIECVESLYNTFRYDNYKLVIIDNKSPNGSGTILMEKYSDDPRIHLIFTEENLGFAKGNNLGYTYAKEVYGADFIVIPNNDTVFVDEQFADKILDIYNETGYGILGPDIQSLRNNEHQNPHRLEMTDLKEVDKVIDYLEKEQFKLKMMTVFNFPWLYEWLRSIKRKLKLGYNNSDINMVLEEHDRMEDVTLHGACVIFSPKFIETFDYAFYPEPFIYLDEDHLHYMCYKNKLKVVYDPSFMIYHKEDMSTETVLSTNLKKMKFMNTHMLDSARILKRNMMEDGFTSLK